MNILWQQPNGTLAMTSIFDGSDPAEHAALLQGRGDVPADWRAVAVGVADECFPQDWPHQEDWRFVSGRIAVDLASAQDRTKDRLRQERAPLLAALDVAFQRNTETGASNAAVIAEKNRLRDITSQADRCTTLAELAALSAQG